MPTSAAERMRKYGAQLRADTVRYEAEKAKERERWKKRRETGKVKTIAEMTPREQRARSRCWHQDNQKRKAQKQQATNNPASTASIAAASHTPQHLPHHFKKKEAESLNGVIVRLHIARYNPSKRPFTDLLGRRRSIEKQATRPKQSFKARSFAETAGQGQGAFQSPRKRARQLLTRDTRNVHRELTFHFALLVELRQRYRVKSTAKAQVLSKVFGAASILQKYRTIQRAKEEFGFSRKAMKSNKTRNITELCYENIRKRTAVTQEVREKIKAFYLQDNVSQPTAGKKETVTASKVKMQVRYLLDSVERLHKRFIIAHQDVKVSISTFCRLNPSGFKSQKYRTETLANASSMKTPYSCSAGLGLAVPLLKVPLRSLCRKLYVAVTGRVACTDNASSARTRQQKMQQPAAASMKMRFDGGGGIQ